MDKNFKHLMAPKGEDSMVSEVLRIFEKSNYNLVRLIMNSGKERRIQIFAENSDHTMTLDDCEDVNNLIQEYFEKELNINENYSLEISSPGIERPLTRKNDFQVWSNNYIKVKLFRHEKLPRRFDAKLLGYSKDKINIFIDETTKVESGNYDLNPTDVKEIKLAWASGKPPMPNKTC
ncbi:MAG: hypothetical protein VX806_01060 [Pseudomonadota bacterium]|nr:hypothetical protein [Pseudomonadota bacterium]